MMASPLDPRVRMRDALRTLVEESPARWDAPSLFVLRNRLLDHTGSDARPLAEFLIEALRRGWRDRLPSGAVDTGRFDAMVAPFVLQWSRERFVQPEMARWAVESWAYALRVIDESQVRVAPPPKRESMSAMAARLNAGAAAAGAQASQAARAVAAAMAGTPTAPAALPRARGGAGMAGKGLQQPAGARGTPRSTVSPPTRFNPSYTPRTPSGGGGSTVPAWIPKALFATLCVMALGIVGRVAVANVTGTAPGRDPEAQVSAGVAPPAQPARLSGAPANSPSAAMSAPMPSLEDTEVTRPLVSTADVPGEPVRRPAGLPLAGGAVATGAGGFPTVPDRRLPAGADPTSARTVSPALTGGVTILAPEKPGVPSITRGLLATGADSGRMVFVQPARRAAGEGRRMQTPSSATPITFDELHFVSGETMRGRVDVVRAGTVIFRDMRTGLRHEYRKDDIAEIITEFGTVVRFRAEGANAAAALGPGKAPATAAARAKAAEQRAPASGVRARGVAGRYRIRYAAASAVGSPECTQVWTRPPNAEDLAVVTHLPGADTLAVAFQGGDLFPSNVDPDGYFASTFRIVPDQARTMTALTTRLHGRFDAAGALDLTVNIVFYRRLRTGEMTCNVTVKAAGLREK
jgi:hypothetical protein